MSPKQAARNPEIKRLIDEGYEVEIQHGYLLIHAVPYVNSRRQVMIGTVITDIQENVGEILPPKDHQVWFRGEYPCHANGSPIEPLRHTDSPQALWDSFDVQYRFSNKPRETGYTDYYSKMVGYINIISNEAKAIDSSATPCTFKVIEHSKEESVFKYRDTASSRADILALSTKLAMGKVTIIGLGGTGSYLLDLVAKTPVEEIDLYDGDLFLQHNAFRAPGAAAKGVLAQKLPKVTYYYQIYEAMRNGINPHHEYITEENLEQLIGTDFVFICVDRGPVRKLISKFLQKHDIPFIDVGMDLIMEMEAHSLIGTCRTTMSTPGNTDHFSKHVPVNEDMTEDLYRKNIQVADMNALNAALAVIKWKQYFGFYQDLYQVHHSTYSINSHSLTRDVMIGVEDE